MTACTDRPQHTGKDDCPVCAKLSDLINTIGQSLNGLTFNDALVVLGIVAGNGIALISPAEEMGPSFSLLMEAAMETTSDQLKKTGRLPEAIAGVEKSMRDRGMDVPDLLSLFSGVGFTVSRPSGKPC